MLGFAGSPRGGPDGGTGAEGCDVVRVVDPKPSSLRDYHRSPHRRARSGASGEGEYRHGAKGEDVVLPVPDGMLADWAVVTACDADRSPDRHGTPPRLLPELGIADTVGLAGAHDTGSFAGVRLAPPAFRRGGYEAGGD